MSYKAGFVGLIGQPNAGKSTLMNILVVRKGFHRERKTSNNAQTGVGRGLPTPKVRWSLLMHREFSNPPRD